MAWTPTSTGPLATDDSGAVIAWPDAVARLKLADTFWLATVDAQGSSHTRPVLAVWVDDALYSATSPTSAKGRHLRRNGRCSIATQSKDLDLVIEGRAVRVTDADELRRVAGAYDTKYHWEVEIRDGAFWAEGAPTAGPPPFHVNRIVPDRVLGFGTSQETGPRSTQWRF